MVFSGISLGLVVFLGCSEKESIFAGWQPPPKRSKVAVVQSDEVSPPEQKRPTITYAMPVATLAVEVKPIVKLIVVSVNRQRLMAYGSNRQDPLETFLCSTAVGGMVLSQNVKSELPHNHLGEFTIDWRDVDHISGEYGCPMPYALHFFEGHWIHATEPKFYDKLGSPASHGCVRLRLDDAKWLFEHTPIGCKLVIQ